MEIKFKEIPFIIVVFIAGLIIGIGLRGCCDKKPIVEVPTLLHDTVSVHDTIRIEGKTRTIYTIDSILVLERDTIKDTIYLPFDTRVYSDSVVTDTSTVAWTIQYSGYKAKIDSFGLTYKFMTPVRVIEKKKGWGQFVGVGIGVGYGTSIIDQRVYAAPEIGLHLTYGWGYHW